MDTEIEKEIEKEIESELDSEIEKETDAEIELLLYPEVQSHAVGCIFSGNKDNDCFRMKVWIFF